MVWKAVENGSIVWTSAIRGGVSDAAPGLWVWPGLTLAIASIWGMNQQLDDLILCE